MKINKSQINIYYFLRFIFFRYILRACNLTGSNNFGSGLVFINKLNVLFFPFKIKLICFNYAYINVLIIKSKTLLPKNECSGQFKAVKFMWVLKMFLSNAGKFGLQQM
jgi:hypothetical protein